MASIVKKCENHPLCAVRIENSEGIFIIYYWPKEVSFIFVLCKCCLIVRLYARNLFYSVLYQLHIHARGTFVVQKFGNIDLGNRANAKARLALTHLLLTKDLWTLG